MPRATTGFSSSRTSRPEIRRASSITATALHGSSKAKNSSTRPRRPKNRRTRAPDEAGQSTCDRATTTRGSTQRVSRSRIADQPAPDLRERAHRRLRRHARLAAECVEQVVDVEQVESAGGLDDLRRRSAREPRRRLEDIKDEGVEPLEHRLLAGGDLLVAARGRLGDRPQERPVLLVHGYGGLERG